MKTIEERAKEYASKKGDISLSPIYNEALANIYKEGYIAGATEQKAIDDAKLLKLKSSWEKQAQINHDDEANYKQGYHDAIEKACEWLKENVEGGIHPQSAYGFVEKFKKAMGNSNGI